MWQVFIASAGMQLDLQHPARVDDNLTWFKAWQELWPGELAHLIIISDILNAEEMQMRVVQVEALALTSFPAFYKHEQRVNVLTGHCVTFGCCRWSRGLRSMLLPWDHHSGTQEMVSTTSAWQLCGFWSFNVLRSSLNCWRCRVSRGGGGGGARQAVRRHRAGSVTDEWGVTVDTQARTKKKKEEANSSLALVENWAAHYLQGHYSAVAVELFWVLLLTFGRGTRWFHWGAESLHRAGWLFIQNI